mgnify:CR=1 FL=1
MTCSSPFCPQEGPEKFWGTGRANLNSHLLSVHGTGRDGNKKVVHCKKCGMGCSPYNKRRRHGEKFKGEVRSADGSRVRRTMCGA